MVGPGRLFWKLFLGNILLMILALGTCVWLILAEASHFQEEELTRYLRTQATSLRAALESRLDPSRRVELDRLAKTITQETGGALRLTLINADGTVLAESWSDPAQMEPHSDREEVTEALADGWGESVRYSSTIGRDMKYVAVALGPLEEPAGVVRVAMGVRTIGEHAGALRQLIWASGLVALASALALAVGLALLWSRPIRRITAAARSISRGELSTHIRVRGADELAVLAGSLNNMRDSLANQLSTIDYHRRTLESLLTQLHEGVVVAGPSGRIVLINPAAARLLGLNRPESDSLDHLTGQAVEECVAQHELQQMLLSSAGSRNHSTADQKPGHEIVREIRLEVKEPGTELAVLARATDIILPVPEHNGLPRPRTASPRTGRLLVLTDISELTRLMQVKADFAANASHELRTPLSAIRASVDTMLKMNLQEEAYSSRHFLAVIDRQSARLEALVNDLLELSRLESARTRFQPADVKPDHLLKELSDEHAEAAAHKNIQWSVHMQPGIGRLRANPHLLRIVLDNLIDNALKFTDAGGRVSVACRETVDTASGGRSVVISVSDTGCGIPPEEQTRVFERFYQVERARSGGAVRGTGLGLSIVRHAVAAMKGSLELESRPGEGTTVTVTIPQTHDQPATHPPGGTK